MPIIDEPCIRPGLVMTHLVNRERLGRSVKGYFERIPDPADHPVFRIETVVETQGAD